MYGNRPDREIGSEPTRYAAAASTFGVFASALFGLVFGVLLTLVVTGVGMMAISAYPPWQRGIAPGCVLFVVAMLAIALMIAHLRGERAAPALRAFIIVAIAVVGVVTIGEVTGLVHISGVAVSISGPSE